MTSAGGEGLTTASNVSGSTRDALSLLTIAAVFVIAVPSRYVVGPLGGAGAPATLVGLVGLGGWVFLHVSRIHPRETPWQPLRAALLLFGLLAAASSITAAMRPGGYIEMRSSIFGVVVLGAWIGIALIAADFIGGWRSLSAMIDRLSLLAGLYALLGIVQYFTREPFTNYVGVVPGLTLNQDLVSISTRDGVPRPASTAIHAIEFGVVLTVLLPICLHVLLHGQHLSRWRRWFPTVAVVLAIPLSISRSAIICGAVAVLALLPTWPSRARGRAFAGLAIGVLAIFVAAPGVLGTLRGLFINIGSDSSATSRTDSYGIAWSFITQHPLFGRGYGTFQPRYRILDNQYLLTTIEVGVVGTAVLLLTFLAALGVTAVARHRSLPGARRDLLQSLFAAVLSGAVGFAFFDAFNFPQYSALTFLLLGLCAAAWRLYKVQDLERQH